MSKIRILVSVLSIIMTSKCYAFDKTKRSTTHTEKTGFISPSMMNTVKSTSKTIGSKLTELFLNRFLPSNSFTLTITNNMMKRRLIDPRMFLKNGDSVTPPLFMMPPVEEPYSGVKQIVMLENDPAGVLCYDNEPTIRGPKSTKAVSCVIFNAKEKQYALYGHYGSVTINAMQDLYEKFTAKSDMTIRPTKNENGGFHFRDYQQFQMIAQQTTGGEVHQLHTEVLDTIANVEFAQKRAVLIIAKSLFSGSLSTLATFTFGRITADVGTTLTLENASGDNVPIVLEEPRWEQNGVKILDIIPWRLSPKESCKIGLVSPFGSGNTFQRSAISLSFKIQGANDRIILSIQWPKTLSFSQLNAYSVSLLTLPPYGSKENTYNTIAISLRELVKKANEDAQMFPSPVIKVGKFQQYFIWQFPVPNPKSRKVEKFVNVLTNMGDGRNNGMTVKVYATIPAPNTNPSTTPPRPKVYSGLADQVPPIL